MAQSIDDILEEKYKKKISDVFKSIKEEDEFEIMFFNYNNDETNVMKIQQYLNMLKYITAICKMKKDVKMENTNTLDVIYGGSDISENSSYRISINTIDSINTYLNIFQFRENNEVFSILAKKLMDNEKNISIIKKIKDMSKTFNVDDFQFRIRLAKEESVGKSDIKKLEKIKISERNRIRYRFKQRVSAILENNSTCTMRIDLTKTSMVSHLSQLSDTQPIYELELEFLPKTSKISKPDQYIKRMYEETTSILRILQQSRVLISLSESQKVIDNYYSMVGGSEKKKKSLNTRQPHSLEIQHVTDILPNRYCVTDKADGDRYNLVICDRQVYLISTSLQVKKTGIKVDKKYDNTIFDGEYIYLSDKRKYLFMAFDCLFMGGQDVRKTVTFMDRISELDKVIDNCFVEKKQKGFSPKSFKGKFNIDNIIKYHDDQIQKYLLALNNDIENTKDLLVRRKYFIQSTGNQDNEIFKYSSLLWKKYIYNTKTACPYILDGLIYHPLEQKYVTSIKESKFMEYKWKPANKNSVDFYITFERDPKTHEIITVYDNTLGDEVQNKPYRICYLHVGKFIRSEEQPVKFKTAYLFLKDGEVRDSEDMVIQDKTVVEFYYNADMSVDEKFRWVPMRSRYDKTDSVRRHRKKYGNYDETAYKVWRSITNPITMNDFNILANDNVYLKHRNILRGKIDHSLILSERKQNVYYQIVTNLAKPMRNFHNWIKSILIYTYFHPIYEDNKQMTVLDLGIGRGGDMMKFYYTKVKYMVGIDLSNEGLIAATEGAISRYNQVRKTHPNFPKMYFINADAGTLLRSDDQKKVIGNMSPQNKKLLDQFFPNNPKHIVPFDRINCQFVIHYLLRNQPVWTNFCNNLKAYLRPGGYAVFTCFDGGRVVNALKGKEKYFSEYTTEKGEKKIFFEIVKRYSLNEKDKVNGLGNAIDVHLSTISPEGEYETEYLVDKDFITQEFDKNCDMQLIETDTFDKLYNVNRKYFEYSAEYEENVKTRQFLMNAKKYYDLDNEVNSACFEMTRLFRYFVFERRDPRVKHMLKQKGGNTIPGLKSNLRYMTFDDTGETSFLRSILELQKTVPNSPSISPIMDLNVSPQSLMDLASELKKSISIIKPYPMVIESYGKYDDTFILYYVDEAYHPIYELNGNTGDKKIKTVFSKKSSDRA